jgi:polar amino acid transport system substrate-binding protein
MDRENRVVTLVADPFPPYQYMKGSQITGLDYEIIRNAFQSQGLNISVTLHPWDECIQRVEEGRADGVFQIAKTPEREKRFLFSDLLRIAKTVFYCNKAKPVALDKSDRLIGQLQKTKTAVVKGYSYGPEFDNLQGIPKISVGSHQESLLELSAKNVDLAIIDEGVGVYLVDVLMLGSKLQRVANFQIDRPLFVAFHRARLEIRKTLNRGLEEIRKNGIYDELMSRYNLK